MKRQISRRNSAFHSDPNLRTLAPHYLNYPVPPIFPQHQKSPTRYPQKFTKQNPWPLTPPPSHPKIKFPKRYPQKLPKRNFYNSLNRTPNIHLTRHLKFHRRYLENSLDCTPQILLLITKKLPKRDPKNIKKLLKKVIKTG